MSLVWNTCAFQTGCQCRLSYVVGIVFFTQFLWHETNVLVNWQLALLPQSGGTEFDPRSVQDHVSVPLWVYMRFSVPEIKSINMYMYIIWICICGVSTYYICPKVIFTKEDNLSMFDSNYFLVPDHQHLESKYACKHITTDADRIFSNVAFANHQWPKSIIWLYHCFQSKWITCVKMWTVERLTNYSWHAT